MLLDIEAGAPVLLIPESSRSKRLLVANLGQLKVRNRFLSAGTHGTFSLRDKVEKLTMAHTFFPSLVSPATPHALPHIQSLCICRMHLSAFPFCLVEWENALYGEVLS